MDVNISDSVVESCFLSILDSRMHYLSAGDPSSDQAIVFLHGMPTSSYLWRHVLPLCADLNAYCVAPDLIGMGQSDKPDIDYTVFDHIEYIKAFITEMSLKNITFVLHGWGSVVGFAVAQAYPDLVSRLAFYESHIRPVTHWHMLSLPIQQWVAQFTHKAHLSEKILEKNYFVRELLQAGMMHHLTTQEFAEYEKPFLIDGSEKPLRQYLKEFPRGNHSPVVELIAAYSTWLESSALPKLMWYGVPGFLTTIDTVSWAKQHLSNLTMAELPEVMHCAQETCPEAFAQHFKDWFV